ncbi:MAG: M1 family metallopeptidase, partial [Ginsengibacter sp.]
MKKAFLILVFSFILNNLFCQLPYFQQQADFKIDVTLNDTLNTLDGYEEIVYTNHSPDTLSFIWFHLWPNAYKNDKTAFSEQLLQLGRTDFYFSDNDKRGYINQLDFKADGITCELEDHPQYLDVVKLILPFSLPPEDSIKITTPFHEKLPYNFSRGGYVEKTYQVTQWYPKPAVYDSKGWHEMPYLDQGEFYSEFGNYSVNITLPEAYIVASTGELQNQVELKKYKDLALAENERDSNHVAELSNLKKSNKSKTLSYVQEKVHDFAWFADKNFIIRHDTLKLKSGKVIDAWSYCTPKGNAVWNNSVQYIKDAIRTRSAWLGEYPYNIASAVEAQMGFSGGMEYPTITSISPMSSAKSLENTIEHEVGHNWNYGILASNERDHPWMDEGMNSYFDERYSTLKFGNEKKEFASIPFLQSRIPDNMDDIVYRTLLASRTDQAIENRSADFSLLNYNEMAYYKTSKWMQLLEDSLGMEVFDSCLKVYYEKWKFKHPYPQDFKKVVAEVSGRDVDSIFALLYKRGPLKPNEKKSLKVVPFISLKQTNKYNYIFLASAAGINYYDKFMPGIV